MKLRPADRLYLIADSSRSRWSLGQAVAQAAPAGMGLVQLREKQLPEDDYLALAKELRQVTARHSARLLLNGRTHLVKDVGADGVHLPREASIVSAREMLGPDALIGYSAHSLLEIRRAERDGADFVTLSPVFPTPSKPGARPLGLKRLAELVAETSLPVYALGGVRLENLIPSLRTGIFGVALMSPILRAEDIPNRVMTYLRIVRPDVFRPFQQTKETP